MRRVLITGAALALSLSVAACGGGAATTSGSSTKSSATPSPSASPTPVSPKETEPTGTYTWRDRIVAVRPANASYSHAAVKGSWTFTSAGCGATTCHGRIVSSAGKTTYRYTWDGTTLRITRPALAQTSACGDAQGHTVAGSSVTVRSRWDYAPSRPTLDASAPSRIVITATQRVAYVKLVRCSRAKNAVTRADDRLVLTRAS